MIVGFANRTLDWNLGLFLGLARLFNFLETVNVFWSSAGVGTRVIGPLILFNSAAAGEKNKVKGLGFM